MYRIAAHCTVTVGGWNYILGFPTFYVEAMSEEHATNVAKSVLTPKRPNCDNWQLSVSKV